MLVCEASAGMGGRWDMMGCIAAASIVENICFQLFDLSDTYIGSRPHRDQPVRTSFEQKGIICQLLPKSCIVGFSEFLLLVTERGLR